MRRTLAVLAFLALLASSSAGQTTYRPGFFRLATEAAFLGRVRIESVSPRRDADGQSCGLVHEAIVIEAISGAVAGQRLRFVGQVDDGSWPPGTDAFAMLFAHALRGQGEGRAACWVAAAPLFAAASPASVVPFDLAVGAALGGEFLPAGPDNLLAGLRFSAIEVVLDERSGHFASWELVRAYARQAPAARKALPLLPDLPLDPGVPAP